MTKLFNKAPRFLHPAYMDQLQDLDLQKDEEAFGTANPFFSRNLQRSIQFANVNGNNKTKIKINLETKRTPWPEQL